MATKRKSTSIESDLTKRTKYSKGDLEISKLEKDYDKLIELLSENFMADNVENPVMYALDFLKSVFPKNIFENLPEIIHLHQLYTLFKNRTQVDLEIDSLRTECKILLFHFESSNDKEILICFTEKFKEYVQNEVGENCKNKALIDIFLNKILPENRLNIDSEVLIQDYRLTDSDISSLVQVGLLAIKDSSTFWFSIPNLGKFRRILTSTRKSLIDLLRRQKYKEINLKLFFDSLLIKKHKNFKTVNSLGVIYATCDLIGNDSIRIVKSPMGLTIKLNA